MKNSKHSIWTVQSQGLKNTKGKMRLQSKRQLCTSKLGFDAALLQLGAKIHLEKHEACLG